jgi:hypothetical protein
MKKLLVVISVLLVFLNGIYAQEVKVNNGKLTIDGCLWGQYYNIKSTTSNITTTVSSFSRRAAFLGLTANLNNWALARMYLDLSDIAGKPAYDLYATVKAGPASLTFGQFKLPLGVEVLTKPENLELIEYSLIGRSTTTQPIRTPKGTRDIGIQAAYKHPLFDVTAALVNGEGRNVLSDIDNNKNFAGRVIVRPLQKSSIFAGVNIYLGKYIENFHRIGAEFNYSVSPIILKIEFLNTKDGNLKGNGYYAQAGYNWKSLQPMFRYSSFKYENIETMNEYVIGLNIRPLNDNLKVMLNYKNEKTSSTNKQTGFIGQLQIAF